MSQQRKKKLDENTDEIRCFHYIGSASDRQYGQRCDRLLMKKNSRNEAAGEVQCGRCKALYELVDGYIILKNPKKE